MNLLTKSLISFLIIAGVLIFTNQDIEADVSPLHTNYINNINSISNHFGKSDIIGYEFTYDVTVDGCRDIFQQGNIQHYQYDSCVSFVNDLKVNTLNNY